MVRKFLKTLRDRSPAMIIELLDDDFANGVATQIEGRGYTAFAIKEGLAFRCEPLWQSSNKGNLLLAPDDAVGFAFAPLDSRGMTYAELLASQPIEQGAAG